MWHPLANLLTRAKLPWEEVDQRHFIQAWLRQQLGTEQVYCQRVRAGVATIRVANPTLGQTILLLEFDLNQALVQEKQPPLTKLRIQLV